MVEMLQSFMLMRRFDPAGLGLAIAVLLSSWAEPYAAPGTISVETRLDVIIGLGLPIILILVVADGPVAEVAALRTPQWVTNE